MTSEIAQIHQNPASNSSNMLDLQAAIAKSNKTGIFQTTPHPQPEPELSLPEPEAPQTYDPAPCEHVKANGVPCGSPALRGQLYCYFHHLWRARPAWKPTRPWNPKKNQVGKLPLLEDANAVQIALQQVLDAILDRRLDLPRARLLLYGLQTAAINVLHTEFDSAMDRRYITTELR